MNEPRRLAVLLAGREVARLERTRAGVLRLEYETDARGATDTPLSLSLPPSVGTFTGRVVEDYLWGLLPDDERARRAIATRYEANARDPLSMLAAVGQDCAGAVQFCLPDEVAATVDRDGTLEPLTDADIEMRLAELRTDEDAGWVMPGEHWSLGGSQQKFALRRTDHGWSEARGSAPTSHIVKPGIYRMTAQALVEHVSMRAAAACGIDVAPTEHLWFRTEPALVVTRFDRAPTGGGLGRLHQEDLCQASGVAEKYEDRGGPTPDDLIRLLRATARTAQDAAANVERFVDALVLNVVIAAPDGHARNYAVLLDHDVVRLAPLFDVASGLAYAYRSGDDRRLAMSIAGQFDASAITGETWRRFAGENRLDLDAVLERVHRYADVVPGAIAAALEPVDDWDGTTAALAGRLLPAVGSHLAAVLRSAG
ncbi:MAG TPA: type II toxin-antitoxin system HipA family toxin [Cellulomonas sp.]